MAKKSKKKRQLVNGRAPGQPIDWTKRQFLVAQAAARQEAKRIFKIMKDQGLLPEQDAMADEALLAVLTLMREPGAKKDIHSFARTILEYTRSKPAAKSDVTVRTAEEWLDDLAEGNDG